jgi:hypothetical protein
VRYVEWASKSRNYGYHIDPKHAASMDPRPAAYVLGLELSNIRKRTDTLLTPYALYPTWTWGWQGTGDCVSWSGKHLGDVRRAVLRAAGLIQKIPWQIRQESLYGFGRVEIYGRPDRGGPGMYGGGLVKAYKRFGHLFCKQYAEADLRRYSGQRAKSWGRTGVPDALEKYAKEEAISDYVQVTDPLTAGLLIQSGIPVLHCGGRAPWGTQRNSDGVAIRFSAAAHSMANTGVRWTKAGDPKYFWIANTGHGNHVTGPVGPIKMPKSYSDCGSWVPASRVAKVLAQGDCYAIEVGENWKILDLEDFGYGGLFS